MREMRLTASNVPKTGGSNFYRKVAAVGVRHRNTMSEITLVLKRIGRGTKRASEDLLPLVYDELRRLAAARMASEAAGQTLQPTALVHEAWLRLVGSGDRTWQSRAHFFGAAAQAMRRILIENARRKSTLKRGTGQSRVDIADLDLAETTPDDRVLLIDQALEQLEAEDPESARIVVLKFFGGLTNKEVGATLQVTERTVERQWAYAKAWLFQTIRAAA
jgi:RNA polymerase sigma factor (TIGR02999 family)